MSDPVKICPCHQKKVPLIATFKFIKKEFWCPHCGYTCGMFGYVRSVEASDEIMKIHDEYKEKAKDFLSGESNEWVYEHNKPQTK